MQLVWFKRDLRVQDHAVLAAASKAGSFVGLYLYEPDELKAPECSARHLQFINQCLEELRSNLRTLGSELLLRYGDAVEVLESLRKELPIDALWSHQENGTTRTYARDRRVAAWARQHRLPWTELPGNGVVRALPSRDGWSARWLARMREPLTPIPSPQSSAKFPRAGEIRSPDELGVTASPLKDGQQGGERAARLTLDSFLHQRGRHYRREMSSPVTAFDACSRISPYLSWGALSVRQAYHAVRDRQQEIRAMDKPPRGWIGSLKSFASRLRWHCHFMQKLEDQPNLDQVNFARVYDDLRQHDEERFNAWAAGRTGYPLVDACMRALDATGYLNFRMRAMLMSFASYQLWLDWRRPGLHLARLFLDYEPGIHWSQVQMQSGTTGINTIRVYSPIKQVADQDPQGHFIRRWLPELRDLPDQFLARPWETPAMEQEFANCRIGKDYPALIVDHSHAYRQAQEKMHALRKRHDARREADQVQSRHGSRKSPVNRSWR